MKSKPKRKPVCREEFTLKYGFLTLEVFPSHKEVVLSRKPLGSDNTQREFVFMSTKGFSTLARNFLNKYSTKPKTRRVRG